MEAEIEIADQPDFYKLLPRFGAIPLDEAPLGYEVERKRRETKKTKFEHAYPRIYLPFQEVQRVEFGYLHAVLETVQWEEDGELHADQSIVQVLRHESRPQQPPLL